jgi:hypothetical protein
MRWAQFAAYAQMAEAAAKEKLAAAEKAAKDFEEAEKQRSCAGGDRSSGSRALKLTAVAAADEDRVNRRREVRSDDAAAQSKSRQSVKLVPKRSKPRTPSQSPSRPLPRTTPSSERRSRWSRRERGGADDRR